MKNFHIVDMNSEEISSINGGLGPVGAYAIAIGLGSLFVAAYQAGYQFGRDIGAGQSFRQPDVKLK